MTSPSVWLPGLKKYFNSHPHKEDDLLLFIKRCHLVISTHILTRRMTDLFLGYFSVVVISTHILTRRMTTFNLDALIDNLFQLTSSQGGWRMSTIKSLLKKAFQLTSSQGGWRLSLFWQHRSEIFQLTSSQGGWRGILESTTKLTNFNSHPHKEDDG